MPDYAASRLGYKLETGAIAPAATAQAASGSAGSVLIEVAARIASPGKPRRASHCASLSRASRVAGLAPSRRRASSVARAGQSTASSSGRTSALAMPCEETSAWM